MRIEFKDYIITHSLGINKFDLSKKVIVKNGKRKGEVDERPEAYGITLERVFRIILDQELEADLEGQAITFKEYLDSYDRVNKEVLKEAQRIEVSLFK